MVALAQVFKERSPATPDSEGTPMNIYSYVYICVNKYADRAEAIAQR